MTEPALTSAQMVLAPSPTQLESSTSPSELPGFFDILPNSSDAVFPPRYRPLNLSPSTARAKWTTKGIYSHDPILNQNAIELWRFLVSHLQRPSLAVHLVGTHTTAAPDESTETVTDFSIRIDVFKFVNPQWTQIVAHPSDKASEAGQGTATPTVRETLEEYASSNNPFKSRLKKFVVWEFQRVRQLLTDLVRSTGYREDVGVQFPTEDYKVVAVASNEFSRAADSEVVRVLCVVSCLFIVFWPAWAIARKCMKCRLDCDYQMRVSADEFYTRNRARIRSAVVQRLSEKFHALES